ncbi:MAG: glucose-6-phosphate 1-dehydrogenase [Parcubacteria group bacterium Gr01-1014_29]|nr:MAG: glucose-6-phosphate 1-dehydrogenase [Parcubacteria group bacterium Gr01-1014_29]
MKNEVKHDTPTTFVIFGATGDLARRKLLPALFDLSRKHMLPRSFRLIGFAKTSRTHEEFQAFVRDSLENVYAGEDIADDCDAFLASARYRQGEFEDAASYERLAELLIEIDERDIGACSNKLFYLAVSPGFYKTIFQNLADSGLTIPCGGERVLPSGALAKDGWTRLLVEKPFGKDLAMSEELERMLALLFKDEQIFRIDHYLAKETVQNILAFRFSNILFEPLWSREFIERVEISLFEEIGVEGRGMFYDSVGALRDVGQNHLLQMLALIAMDDPKEMEAPRIRTARTQALGALRMVSADDVDVRARRGQYEGFMREEGVRAGSTTETSFRVVAYVDNERWRGVPFILEAAKKHSEKKTEINIYFKYTERCLCPPEAEHHHQNVLTFRIQPDEAISVVFWAKKPGFATELEPKRLSFSYKESFEKERIPDAYERVLYDCIRGDQTLFASTEEVQAAWKFTMSVLENWNSVELKKD